MHRCGSKYVTLDSHIIKSKINSLCSFPMWSSTILVSHPIRQNLNILISNFDLSSCLQVSLLITYSKSSLRIVWHLRFESNNCEEIYTISASFILPSSSAQTLSFMLIQKELIRNKLHCKKKKNTFEADIYTSSELSICP